MTTSKRRILHIDYAMGVNTDSAMCYDIAISFQFERIASNAKYRNCQSNLPPPSSRAFIHEQQFGNISMLRSQAQRKEGDEKTEGIK